MGCIQILLEDRFNEQVQNIYQKVIKYILNEMGKEFDGLPYLGPEDSALDALLEEDNFSIEGLKLLKNESEENNVEKKEYQDQSGSLAKSKSVSNSKQDNPRKKNSPSAIEINDRLRQIKIGPSPDESEFH